MLRSKRLWQVVRLSRRLWVRATLYCLAGVATALVAVLLGPFIPQEMTKAFGADAVDPILSIIASSMLAVTTFSLSTLVAATSAAASGATPRATSLLLEDTTAQRALSTFLGTFLFSLVGLIGLHAGLYGGGGRLVLFVVTLGVIAVIVLTLLRWIDHLSTLGRVSETIDRVKTAAISAMRDHLEDPLLGGAPLSVLTPGAGPGSGPPGAVPVSPATVGYLQHIDMPRLQALAEAGDLDLHLAARTGSFCAPGTPVLFVRPRSGGRLDAAAQEALLAALTIGARRTFEQDPRFGLIVLAEIASRALSPAINDPGTAIDVMTTMVEVFAVEPRADHRRETPDFPRVHVPPLTLRDMFEDAFLPIARDGADNPEIGIRLQKCLRALARLPGGRLHTIAREIAATSLARGLDALAFEGDRTRLTREAFVEV
ncbi:hypothetical protein ASG25_03575 [Rhizobium sp. Leaf384]|uniref:DUF2254 domain-containing protein n=1 Tax=unclassified Rhizobium TaxID=2613769 RepID=UPI000713BB11|nr:MULTISPECIES: DUF2254 domain-containing protein [unclassified Rhizobium]KQS77518.1 hypothetical protein ASG58_10750 [Rhizobium sp. Leaf383]KQS81528.1 hypothetical protein ASG25_03575 [Rhizobium sp. Leaf384]